MSLPMSRAPTAYRPARSLPGPAAAEIGGGDPRAWTDRKRCSHCQRVKPLGQFCRDSRAGDGRQSWCRRCSAVGKAEYYRSQRFRETQARYMEQPGKREAKRESDRRSKRRRKAEIAAYRQTQRGRLFAARSDARWRLKTAGTEKTRQTLLRRIAACEAELARMDAETAAG